MIAPSVRVCVRVRLLRLALPTLRERERRVGGGCESRPATRVGDTYQPRVIAAAGGIRGHAALPACTFSRVNNIIDIILNCSYFEASRSVACGGPAALACGF